MNIVLFYPRGYDNKDGKASISSLAVSLPPMGLASIAAVLKQGGHRVTLIDASIQHKVADSQWVEKIISRAPEFIGFSTITSNFLNAYEICEAIKEKNADILTVFGGVHVSWGKETILENFPAIDFVIAGEGEYAFLKIAKGENPTSIPGVYSRDNIGKPQGIPQEKEDLCVMDELPFPAYDIIDGFPKKYAMPLFSYPRHPGASVISSRGCVYACSFCDRSVYQNSFRWNSPEYTFELVKWLQTDFGIKHIMFYDDLFTMNRKRVFTLCKLLRKNPTKLSFNCIVRIGHIDEELIKELKTAGCWMVHVGIESGDQEQLDNLKQGLQLEQIRSDIEKLHKNGLWVKGLFMMGMPGETEKSIQKTIDFACSLPLKDANVTAFTPFPGAPISSTIESFGEFSQDFSQWPDMDCVNFVFVPKTLPSKNKLQKYYGEFIKRFYQRKSMRKVYKKMVFQSPHSYWRLIKQASRFIGYSKRM